MCANKAAGKVSCELKLTFPKEDPPALQGHASKIIITEICMLGKPHDDITSLKGI